MKQLLPWVTIGALVLLFLCALDSSCQKDAALAQAKVEYEALKAETAHAQSEADERIAALAEAIADKESAIVQIERNLAQYVAKTTTLTAELTALQSAEPAQPELESEPLVINLRAQVVKLSEMFSLATGTITAQSQEIDALKGKAALWQEVAAEWRGKYERETTLRLNAESLFRLSERRRKADRIWKYAAPAAALAVGYLIGK